MEFKQTKVFMDLSQHFANIADNNKYTTNREQTAADMVERYSQLYGIDKIKQVAKKANQKAKCQFYNI